MTLLQVENLELRAGAAPVVRELSFNLAAGEILAIAGESGSGKTLTAVSLLNLLPPGITRHAGRIVLDGTEVYGAAPAALQHLRGGSAGMIFQEPLSSLNPLQRVGQQIAEASLLHRRLSRAACAQHVLELLAQAGLDHAKRFARAFPHELSGGQRQRVMIAMALANNPKLLIADEPTTALDSVLARQVLDLIAAARTRRGLAVLLITHDLANMRRYADRVMIMAKGRAVETQATAAIFSIPLHIETQKLLAAKTFLPPVRPPETAPEILRAEALTLKFPLLRGPLRRQSGEIVAADNVSFSLRQGETLGIIGESGAGKSSLALMLLRLVKFSGSVVFDGTDIQNLRGKNLRAMRRKMQIVFQDPYGSLPPRMTVGEIIMEGLEIHASHLSQTQRAEKLAVVLQEVSLPPSAAQRYPHAFSGGQRQRIAIARALILQPKLLVLDEPTSALDVTVQAEILRLLLGLQQRHGISYVFISHDLALVRALAHRILVLKGGKTVEYGSTEEILSHPRTAYMRMLIANSIAP